MKKKTRPTRLENGLPYATQYYPSHVVKIALLIKNNAEYRRLLSLTIKHLLEKEGICTPNDKFYVVYYWNKFSISINGLKREEYYSSNQFVNCLAIANNLFITYSSRLLEQFMSNDNSSLVLDFAGVEEETSELNNELF